MEPMIFMGGVIVIAGGIWTIVDLLQDAGITLLSGHKTSRPKAVRQRDTQKISASIFSC
jgi:hypothetical protein